MWTESDLQELLSYESEGPTLSVYLDLDPASGTPEAHHLRLKEILRPLEDDAEEDSKRVLRYFEQHQAELGRGAAIFSNQKDDFFRSFSLAVPVRSRARLLSQPFVKPLAQLLDSYGHFGVALIDQQSARFFHLHLGELAEETSWQGEPVRHTKRGGGSQAQGRRGGTAGQTRYSEEVAERNLKEAAQIAGQFFKRQKVRRIILGGSEANVAFFRDTLPKVWQTLIIGSFPIDMNASVNEVTERSLEVAEKAEHDQEQAIVSQLITTSSKGGEAVLTLDETLEAVHAGRVQHLVISEGYRQPGYRCQGCEYLTVQELPQCPFCGEAFQQIDDAVEFAVRKVLEGGGEVEIISHADKLDQAGKIGALLRY
ncbi:MAG: hypothetical protein ACLFWD_03240 [Anaerolineales bacterium]